MPKWTEVPKDLNRAYKIGEAGKVRWDVLRYCIGTGLDLGCGGDKIHKNAIGIDRGAGSFGRPSQANLTGDIQDLKMFADQSMHYVFSSHALEHIPDWKAALREWWRVVKMGGYLILYLPHPDYYDDPEGSKDHVSKIGPNDLMDAMMGAPGGWNCLRLETRSEGDEYSFLAIFQKQKKGKTKGYEIPPPEKRWCVFRAGGVGDHLMFSSVVERLARDGNSVVYVTNPAGEEVVRHDPNIAEIWTDTAGLDGPDILSYWRWLEVEFEGRFTNGMNLVENALLPQPTAPQYGWPERARRALWGQIGYLEFQHLIAGVPMDLPPRTRFYATKEEEKWAREERKRILGHHAGPLILWAMTGSSVHKVSPYTPAAVDEVLRRHPEAVVVTTGGPKEALLYQDFSDHPRHVRRAGTQWTIRQALTFAHVADCVVGPETGTLNAVGTLPIPKAVWLSHSSETNLCKHWVDVVAVSPDPNIAPCAPCHRLHWGWEACRRGPSGAALCVEAIGPLDMADAVDNALGLRAVAAA